MFTSSQSCQKILFIHVVPLFFLKQTFIERLQNETDPDEPVLFLQCSVTPNQSEAGPFYAQVELGAETTKITL